MKINRILFCYQTILFTFAKQNNYQIMYITLRKLEKADFNFGATCLFDMSEKYIKIDGRIYFVHRLNKEMDLCLKAFNSDEDLQNIGYIRPATKRYFVLEFRHFGFLCQKKIRYFDVKYTTGFQP